MWRGGGSQRRGRRLHYGNGRGQVGPICMTATGFYPLLHRPAILLEMARAFLGYSPIPLSPPTFRTSCAPSSHLLFNRVHCFSSVVHSETAAVIMPDQRKVAPDVEFSQPHPSLEVIGGGRDRFLSAFKSLHRPYNPFPVLAWNCHVETIFAAFFRSCPDVKFRRECLRMKDDGTVSLDWVSGDRNQLPPDSPVLILLPGLTGGSQDTYVRHMLVRARNCGYRVVVFNSRGCGNSPVTSPQFYSASFLDDIREVVAHVSALYSKANLYAVGWSLGGNVLVNYLGQESSPCPLSGAVSLCNPFDLVLADEGFHTGFNLVYDKALAKALRTIFTKHAELFEEIGGEFNTHLAMNAKSIRDYDDAITRVSFGFKTVDEYYSYSGSSNFIKHVKIPLLCIQAANDPIAPDGGIPREDIKENPNCILIVTPKGGHLGWVAGDEAPFGAPWTDPFVMDFLQHLQHRASTSLSSPQSVDILV